MIHIHRDEPEVHRSFRRRGDFVDFNSGGILVTGETRPKYANFITAEFWASLNYVFSEPQTVQALISALLAVQQNASGLAPVASIVASGRCPTSRR
jgi:hypothetical protein